MTKEREPPKWALERGRKLLPLPECGGTLFQSDIDNVALALAAVRREVLEEAAKAAMDFVYSRSNTTQVPAFRVSDIGAAIRALANEDPK